MRRIWLAIALLCACGGEEKAKPPPAFDATPAPTALPKERVLRFCADSIATMRECLDDDAFWDVMFTVYAAQYPDDAAEPDARTRWVGVMKDTVAGITAKGEVAANCEATVANTRWPTAAQVERVEKARATSCTDFANAYAWMLFGEGVFHAPDAH
jgi:hypothetical protein